MLASNSESLSSRTLKTRPEPKARTTSLLSCILGQMWCAQGSKGVRFNCRNAPEPLPPRRTDSAVADCTAAVACLCGVSAQSFYCSYTNRTACRDRIQGLPSRWSP